MSETFNIFDTDNLILEFSNSDLNASLTTTEDGLIVNGKTTVENDGIYLVWETKDNINHGYCRYTTQKNLSGTILEFKVKQMSNVYPYTDTFEEQYISIIDNNQKEYRIPLGNLGIANTFDSEYLVEEEIVEGYQLALEERWIIKESGFSIKYKDTEDTMKQLLEDVDFRLDYKTGIITFLKDFSKTINIDTKLRIRGFRHSDEEYKIKFSSLRTFDNEVVLVDNVKCIKLPINIDNEISKDNQFVYELCEIKVTRGGQSWLKPTELKKHNVELGENYKYTRGLNPRRLIYNIEKMGYRDKLIINIGDGDFTNVVEGNVVFEDILNIGFKTWYTDLQSHAFEKGFGKIQIVIPMYNKYLTCNQKTKSGSTIDLLSPANPVTIEYLKSVISAIESITTDIPISFILEDLKWGRTENGDMSIYDQVTINNCIKSVGHFLSGTGNIYDYPTIVDDDIEVANFLSGTLLSTLLEITAVAEAEVIVYDSMIRANGIYFSINNYYKSILNHCPNVYISKDYSGKDVCNTKELLEISKTVFGVDGLNDFVFCVSGIDKIFNNKTDSNTTWDIVTTDIQYTKFELGIDTLIFTGDSVRKNSYFLFNPLSYVELSRVGIEHDIALCKVNKEIISVMDNSTVTSITRKVDDIDEIEVKVPFYIQDRFTHRRVKNPYYDELKTERLIRLNGKEFFVIKEITEGIGETTSRTARAYSLEHKLTKRPVMFTKGQSLQLYSDDIEQPDGILNILESETGWKVGYINEECRFESVDEVLKTKYRYFEEINTTWYSFLMEEVSTLFDCLFQFNTGNRTVNVYPNTILGANTGLYLTEDNYIKNIERTDNTTDIVTRLSLLGREDLNIYEVNPLGTDYVENFDYFIDNGEMSDSLVNSLKKYYSTVESLSTLWSEKNFELLEKKNLIGIYKYDIKLLDEQIKVLEDILAEYEKEEDTENADRIKIEIEKLKKDREELLGHLTILEEEVPKLQDELVDLTSRMSKETIVDENNDLLFTDELLGELQEFIYHETYTDDSFTTPDSLMKCGINVLNDRSKPTTEYTIDMINFLERITHKRVWDGDIHLRDVILLKSEKHSEPVELFVVGFTYSPESKKIDIDLSNKITTKNSTKTIAEILKIAKETSRLVNLNKYLWAKAKEDVQI